MIIAQLHLPIAQQYVPKNRSDLSCDCDLMESNHQLTTSIQGVSMIRSPHSTTTTPLQPRQPKDLIYVRGHAMYSTSLLLPLTDKQDLGHPVQTVPYTVESGSQRLYSQVIVAENSDKPQLRRGDVQMDQRHEH